MGEPSTAERCKLAAGLIEQAPPGEVNDVINDIRAIIGDDSALMPSVLPALRSYNLAQLHVVEHSTVGGSPAHSSLLSKATILPGSSGESERYGDVQGKRSFAFDHVALTASDFEPYELPEEDATFRAELAKSLSAYTKNHFASGQSSVSCSQYPLLPSIPTPLPPASSAVSETVSEGKGLEDPITDIVPEQVAGGDAEPAPTPAIGEQGVHSKMEEVEEPGGLEKVDELIEEAKQEEEGGLLTDATGGAEKPEEPLVEESRPDEEPIIEAAVVPQAEEMAATTIPERRQERVENPLYTLEVVGNRYNPSNFWTGRWRTQWIVDQAAQTVQGSILVDVHYYEQGNVQLAARHSASFPCPTEVTGSQSIASQIVTTISKIETSYHLELNDVYGELGEKAFRALRRALPVTRQKMEWEKVSGYSLGSDLTKARA